MHLLRVNPLHRLLRQLVERGHAEFEVFFLLERGSPGHRQEVRPVLISAFRLSQSWLISIPQRLSLQAAKSKRFGSDDFGHLAFNFLLLVP